MSRVAMLTLNNDAMAWERSSVAVYASRADRVCWCGYCLFDFVWVCPVCTVCACPLAIVEHEAS